MTPLITSFANPTVKRVRALADRKRRRQDGAFVVEGLQPVWRAVTSGWPIRQLVVAPELLINDDARQMVRDRSAAGVPVAEVSREVFARLSGRDGPAGLLAIVGGTLPDLTSFAPGSAGPVLALETPGNPGNVGTLIRTADAADAAGAILLGHTADPFAPTAVKASMGSIFHVPLAHAATVDELFDWSAKAGRPVVAVTGHTDRVLWDTELADDCVLLLGSEGDGLADATAARCDTQVMIPMGGTAESLNLAIAGSLVLYELRRRRHGGRE